MCRHLAYVGPAVPLGALLRDAPHALVRQGRAAREMIVATENPHGWGVAWWSEGVATPRRYRTATTMWEDDVFGEGTTPAVAVLGAVRRASPGMAGDPRNNAPFLSDTASGPVAFSLNGYAFAGGREAKIRAALPSGRADTIEGETDSEVLFALVCDRVDEGTALPEALAATYDAIEPDGDLYVNLLATDGDSIAATTWNHTLYVLATERSTLVASERLDDDPAWRRVADRSLVTTSAGLVEVTAL